MSEFLKGSKLDAYALVLLWVVAIFMMAAFDWTMGEAFTHTIFMLLYLAALILHILVRTGGVTLMLVITTFLTLLASCSTINFFSGGFL